MKYIPLDDVEHLERYRPGGYHPTLLGDKLQDNRYEIIHKLGFGSNSIVWLARDEKAQSCVAIKISVASATGAHGECDILRMLSSKTIASSLRKTLLPLILDEFDIEGPNGRHHCTVTLPARTSISDAKDASRCRLFQLSVARAITAQLIQGVAWLHSLGIVHSGWFSATSRHTRAALISVIYIDLHTGNVLLHLLDDLTPEQVAKNYDPPELEPIVRIDGKPLGDVSHIPTHAVVPIWLRERSELISLPDARILLSDFGESFVPSHTPRYYSNTPAILRPPEVYFLPKEPVSFPADIWTLACTIFSILGQRELFEGLMPDANWMIHEHVDALGKLPPKWWDTWEGRAEWFSEHGERIDGQPQRLWEERFEYSVQEPRRKKGMEEVGEQEKRALFVMLRGMLAYDPQLRPTAGALLDSEWMRKWGILELERVNLGLT
jgi:serine/threonine-protein kinase SRPK3